MSYVGNTPTTQSFIAGTDYFNGTGSATAFTLSRSVVSVNDIQATVNNVVQVPNDAYTVSGTTITFTSAPSAGTNNIYVRYLSTTTQSITPSQNTVSYSTLNSDNQSKLGISFKNRIINGAMVIDQRNAGASVTASTIGTVLYSLDRWAYYAEQASKFTVQQNAGSVTPPTGFTYYLGVTSLSAYSPISTDQFIIRQNIEGYNFADLGWGTANAKTITVSFWVYSSLTGTFAGNICNYNGTRSYVYSYTINSANTWEQKSVTISGDTSGTWLTTNTIGASFNFALGTGSSYQSAAGVWNNNYKLAPSGAVNVVGTNGATFYITGVQLEVGTQATTFDYRSITTEYALCQRYYEKSYDPSVVPGVASSLGQFFATGTSDSAGNCYASIRFAVIKRAQSTMTGYRGDGGGTGSWQYERNGSSGSYSSNFDAVGYSGARCYTNNGSAGYTATVIYGQWTASAEL